MKQLLLLSTCIGVTCLVFVASCNKNDTEPGSSYRRPVARAGDDIFVQLSFCSENTVSAELDGSGSFDPDSNSLSYSWKHISGLPNFVRGNPNLPQLRLERISVGSFGFELTVTDQEGFIAKDTVNVVASIEQHNLDISTNGDVRFIDNYHYTDYYYDYFLDSVEINGKGDFSPFGEFHVRILEYSDSADLSDSHYTVLNVYRAPLNDKYIFGVCSVNFKHLIKKGGGIFDGTLQLMSGSATNCGLVLTNLLPLSITGELDLASKKISMRIQGRVYL